MFNRWSGVDKAIQAVAGWVSQLAKKQVTWSKE